MPRPVTSELRRLLTRLSMYWPTVFPPRATHAIAKLGWRPDVFLSCGLLWRVLEPHGADRVVGATSPDSQGNPPVKPGDLPWLSVRRSAAKVVSPYLSFFVAPAAPHIFKGEILGDNGSPARCPELDLSCHGVPTLSALSVPHGLAATLNP